MKDDTVRGSFPGIRCSDCGVCEVEYQSSNAGLTSGGSGYFCQACMSVRVSNIDLGIRNLSLGQTDYEQRGLGRVMRISYNSSPQDGYRPPMALAVDLSEMLGLEVAAGYDTEPYCKFYWDRRIADNTHITRILNQLRTERPALTVSVFSGGQMF